MPGTTIYLICFVGWAAMAFAWLTQYRTARTWKRTAERWERIASSVGKQSNLPHATNRRTPVCFRHTIAAGETVTIRPGAAAPESFEADRLVVPTDAPRCFTMLRSHLHAPVSLTVRNDGTEAAVFEATLLGNTPGGAD